MSLSVLASTCLHRVFPSFLQKRAETKTKAKAKAAKDAAVAESQKAGERRRSQKQEASKEQVNAGTTEAPAPAHQQQPPPVRTGSAPVASLKKQERSNPAPVKPVAGVAQPSTPTASSVLSFSSPAGSRDPMSAVSPAAAVQTRKPPQVLPPPSSPAKTAPSLSPVIQFGNVGVGGDSGWSETQKVVDEPRADAQLQQQSVSDPAEGTGAVGNEERSVAHAAPREDEAGCASIDSVATTTVDTPSTDEPPPTSRPAPGESIAPPPTASVVEPTGTSSREIDPSPSKQQRQHHGHPTNGQEGIISQPNEGGGRDGGQSLRSGGRGGGGRPQSSQSRPSPSHGQQPFLNSSSSSNSHGPLPPMARGLLSSPSLAGSVPAPHLHASWKPLPVGMASTVLSGSNNIRSNGEWAHGRGAEGRFGAGSASQGQQRGNFGASSAPPAPGAPGWYPASAINPPRNGGVVGMLGANGGGSSVGGRLRTAPEAFGLSAGPTQAMPPAGYGGIDGSAGLQQQHNRLNDADQGVRLSTSLAGGATGSPFGGFVWGSQDPGARQPLMPPGMSPGVPRMSGGGGARPSLAQQLPQPQQAVSPQQQQQQQRHLQQLHQPLYGSFAGGVGPAGSTGVVASSTQHTVPITTWQQPSSQHVATGVSTGVATSTPALAAAEGVNSGLAAEAPPFIPAGAMGVGSPAMWGIAGPQPRQQTVGMGMPPAVSIPMNPMMLNQRTMGHGVNSSAGPMGLGPTMGPAPVPLARPPPPPAMFATQQVVQQAQQQQPQHQQQQQQVRVKRRRGVEK